MVRVHRFRYADPMRIESHPVDTGTLIDIGDWCWLDTDDAKNANTFTHGALNLDQVQANFAALAIGIAMDTSYAGETDPIAIATEGIFEFCCAAAQFEIGDLVGVDDDATPLFVPGQVIAVGENGAASAIGRCVRQYTANTTRVLVELLPRKQVTPQFIPLYQGSANAGADIVTDWAVTFPFHLNRLHTVVTVLTDTGNTILTVHNGAQALDDTLTVDDASAVGTVDVAVMNDATGDDIFIVGDTLSVISDGGMGAGEILVFIEVTPFLRETDT